MSIETDRLYREIEDWKKAGRKWMIDSPKVLREFLEHNDDVLRDLVKKETELKEIKLGPKIDWGNLRHDEELDKLLQPTKPLGAELARKAENTIFRSMLEWKVWKIYVWDDFHSNDNTARWDLCIAPIRPEDKACREQNFAHLVAMSDWHFERLVSRLPKSPNEDIVRKWRDEMRKIPLAIHAAREEAPPMDWSDCEFKPDLIKKELL